VQLLVPPPRLLHTQMQEEGWAFWGVGDMKKRFALSLCKQAVMESMPQPSRLLAASTPAL
jgi:hypothetical protein